MINTMSHYLPLARVARLVGVTRSTLQRMIRDGEMMTFDGQIELDELLRVFPNIKWQADGEYERVEEIKRKAFGKRVMERALPDKEVLAERLFELGKEFAGAKSMLIYYDQIFRWLETKMDAVAEDDPEAFDALQSLKIWLRQELDAVPEEAERGKALLAEESVMRVMSARVTVQPSGHEFFVEGNDTLLEAALRAGISLNYGCSNGNCGECKVRLVSGKVKKVHPHDYVFHESDKANGAILMCSYTAITDLVIEASVTEADDIPHQSITTKVRSVEPLDHDLTALHLTTPRSQRLHFLAGQSVKLTTDDIGGEFYVASCPCEDRHIELHIRRDNTPFSRKVFNDLGKEAPVILDGPHGHCVIKMDSRRPAVFVAWDDGFAPIKSLIQHALSLEMAEGMELFWISERLPHYQENLCRSWADALDNFHYRPLFAAAGEEANVAAILAEHPDLSRADFYVAGPAGFLDRLKAAAIARNMSPLGWHGETLL
ncbi:MAG: flavodoxin oxidoreductase [Hydrogenophilales bacterium CG03_land_8_20_14_0_80_62_28]|nr:MAG: flavodoxin oxidoreductase [Hydrogenophilaceae bacterium CG1_02_62_390]PIV24206.1 MAG: flavodoxin oxidoreductase [Hydrogenophilales bacterium CG03_land_8_20_14_0_80_62_28]PIW37594.1 MAG: flavodoxin oxidoreductase [Hydrogenophilales bacterium CG15_BIG_FIL_POST_REV_8_21_14_020_62_31]PIW70941.1 MAG: flavodoxin oxidoreductase [Hydrogenophilales bacterium CG12_big_fil_rev_8_21_14_0_65_61_21]PIX01777.1 MAG: flavodoxin oxidoreductase [Hydrogenophilales bacterium CG_4_8_14_3_um_filter_62_83]PIY